MKNQIFGILGHHHVLFVMISIIMLDGLIQEEVLP